jgi:lysophospholipase L1-like esterase
VTPLARLLVATSCGLALASARADILPRIVIIGDSIQTGINLEDASAQASATLQRLGNVIVQNFSRPGARLTDAGFVPGMHDAGQAIGLLHGPYGHLDGLVINLGTNDWAQNADLDVFERDYDALLASLPPGLRVVCMGPTWSAEEGRPNAGGHTKDDFRAATRRACGARGIPYIEGRDAIPASRRYFPDGVHPDDAGHELMGRWLRDQLAARGWID